MVIIITGEKGAGKSTNLIRLLPLLKANGLRPAGVISRGFWKDGKRAGYEALNAASGECLPLASTERKDGFTARHCAYYFNMETFRQGNLWIAAGRDADVLIVDEVGNIEIQGAPDGGWDTGAALENKNTVILSVREDLTGKVRERLHPETAPVIKTARGEDISAVLFNMITA